MNTKSFLPTFVVSVALIASAAHAACPSMPTASRFSLSGAEVTDLKTGLVWARCSAGQTWSGYDCIDAASTYTHEQALAYAQSQTGWRLPNAKELASIADKGCVSPSIDALAFPSTAPSVYWSSSPYAGNSAYAWFVYFYYGYVSYNYRSGTGHVRLVRASQ